MTLHIVPTSIFTEVLVELRSAMAKFPPMHSKHEGYAVLLEEVTELWDAIRCKECPWAKTREEAIQVAAMAIRFILDMEDIQ